MKKILILFLLSILSSCNFLPDGGHSSESHQNNLTIEIPFNENMNKIKLTKGTYLVDHICKVQEYEYIDYSSLRVYLYNKYKKKVDLFAPFEKENNSYLSFLNNTFVIPENDTYYIKFFSETSSSDRVVIKKLDYETSFKDEKELTSNIKGKIEGIFDIDVYRYENKENKKIAKLSNNLDSEAYIICKFGLGEEKIQTIFPKEEKYIVLETGITSIGFTHKSGVYGKMDHEEFICSYDFDFELFEAEFGLGLLGDMEEMTSEFSKKIYTVGLGFYDSRLSLKVEKEGIYQIESDSISNPYHFKTKIETETGETTSGNGHSRYFLTPGNYLVYLVGDDRWIDTGRVRYVYISTEDQEVTVDVPVVDFNGGQYNYMEVKQIENLKQIKKQDIKYHFTLSEKSHILYDEDNVYIFDKSGKPLTIHQYGQAIAILTLDAGDYYFTTPNFDGRESIFFCRIINFECDYDYSLTNPVILEENKELTIKADWRLDQELLKITLEEDCTIKFTFDGGFHMFNSDLKFISMDSFKEKIYNLAAGEYYIRIKHEEIGEIKKIKYEIVS